MNNLRRYLDDEVFNNLVAIEDYVDKSLKLVEILFRDRVDKEGKPYIGHLLRVSDKMGTPYGKCLGLLHDVVEDIPGITFDDLLDFGIPKEVVEALRLVTKEKTDKVVSSEEKLARYNMEIDNIINSNNILAISLKYSDMSDNYNKERIARLDSDKQIWFKKKYENNLMKLERKRESLFGDSSSYSKAGYEKMISIDRIKEIMSFIFTYGKESGADYLRTISDLNCLMNRICIYGNIYCDFTESIYIKFRYLLQNNQSNCDICRQYIAFLQKLDDKWGIAFTEISDLQKENVNKSYIRKKHLQ